MISTTWQLVEKINLHVQSAGHPLAGLASVLTNEATAPRGDLSRVLP
ncbi:hypothetical protein Hsar01_01721 [Haloferula sargassicola]|uniref:Transposase n=1 Tax=Haloferula sargassicola TaxID=490096 RepID=A0ABP9UMF7_9BACT